MVYFLYGLAQYFLSPNNEEVRKKSKSIMIWGVTGLFIMTAVFGIEKLILGTFKINNIKINGNGEYVVETGKINANGEYEPGTAADLPDRTIAPNASTGADITKGLSNSSLEDVPELDITEFTTSPFPKYEENSLCWQKPIHQPAATEYEAMEKAKDTARTNYESETGYVPSIDPYKDVDGKNKKIWIYPKFFDTKVLFDIKRKQYHAWIDARGPQLGGTDKDCNLKIIAPARVIADGVKQVSVSDQSTPDNIDPKVFKTWPFPLYEENEDSCWHYPPNPGKADNEFEE